MDDNKDMIKNNRILIGGGVAALSYLILESVMHVAFFEKDKEFHLLPDDMHELWERLIVCGLIVIFSIFAHRISKKIYRQKEVEIKTLKATMRTVQDIVGNALNNLQLFRMELDEDGEATAETLKMFDEVVETTQNKLKALGDLKEIEIKDFGGGRNVVLPKE